MKLFKQQLKGEDDGIDPSEREKENPKQQKKVF